MNTSRINLSSARFTVFKNMMDEVEGVLREHDIDFYVLGALARDIYYADQNISSRTTADVDLAVFIGEGKKFDGIKNQLIEQKAKKVHLYDK